MELKFRAWHKEHKEYYEVGKIDWDEGFVFLHNEFDSSPYNFDEVIIEQYTSLKDKNGKDIYVGDIIYIKHPFKEREHTGEVTFEEYGFNIKDFYFTHFDNPSEAFSEGTDYMEIIGNIHENGELLK